METFELFGNEQSGHAYKIALALTLSQIPFDYRWVDIDAPCETRPRKFRENSPWCEVPLLFIDNVPHIQSGAILLHLGREFGALGGVDKESHAAEWIMWEANRIGMCLPQLILAKKDPQAIKPEALDFLNDRFEIDRARLDQILERQSFLGGGAPNVADMAVFGYVYLAKLYNIKLAKNIYNWINRIEQLNYFQTPEDLLASDKDKSISSPR